MVSSSLRLSLYDDLWLYSTQLYHLGGHNYPPLYNNTNRLILIRTLINRIIHFHAVSNLNSISNMCIWPYFKFSQCDLLIGYHSILHPCKLQLVTTFMWSDDQSSLHISSVWPTICIHLYTCDLHGHDCTSHSCDLLITWSWLFISFMWSADYMVMTVHLIHVTWKLIITS